MFPKETYNLVLSASKKKKNRKEIRSERSSYHGEALLYRRPQVEVMGSRQKEQARFLQRN